MAEHWPSMHKVLVQFLVPQNVGEVQLSHTFTHLEHPILLTAVNQYAFLLRVTWSFYYKKYVKGLAM